MIVVTLPAAAARVARREPLPLGAARVVDVDVGVDETGQQHFVIGEIDDGRGVEPGTQRLDRDDAPRRHADLARRLTGRRHDALRPDHQVNYGHDHLSKARREEDGGMEPSPRYYAPRGGLPKQTDLTTDRAVFTEAYAVIPARTMSDITASLPPLGRHPGVDHRAAAHAGFAETFAQYVVEVSPGGGSDRPEPDTEAEGVLFVVEGRVTLTTHGARHELTVLTEGATPTSRPVRRGPSTTLRANPLASTGPQAL